VMKMNLKEEEGNGIRSLVDACSKICGASIRGIIGSGIGGPVGTATGTMRKRYIS
jgi:hypothetical protein